MINNEDGTADLMFALIGMEEENEGYIKMVSVFVSKSIAIVSFVFHPCQ